MHWYEPLVGETLRNWLAQAGKSHYANQKWLDPFATSMRDFNDVPPQLETLSAGKELTHGVRPSQRLTDLRAASLVSDGSNTLSPLGKAVLDGWRRYGVMDAGHEHELHRNLILLLESIRLRDPFYQQVIAYWRELSTHFDPASLLQHWDKLFILTHLDYEYDGFSPGAVIRAAKVRLDELDTDVASPLSVLTAAHPDASNGAKKITDAIQSQAARGRHRATFCLAVELLLSDLNRSDSLLKLFGVPNKPDDWKALSSDDQALAKRILSDFGIAVDLAGQKEVAEPVFDVLNERKNVILYGPPGTGKTRAALAVADVWKSLHGPSSVYAVTFHPSYSYEDFVWGFRPQETGNFIGTPGVLLQAAKSALAVPTLLLIDEVNRADTARAFGELITYIERDKRGRTFRIAQDSVNEYEIPAKLHILCTMNTADRSISLLDVALRRRFAFIEYVPDPSAFGSSGLLAEVGGVQLADVLKTLNQRLLKAGVELERAIGQALLAISPSSSEPVSDLVDRFRYDILPLIEDYCYTDRNKIIDVLRPLLGDGGRLVSDETDFIKRLAEFVGKKTETSSEAGDNPA